MEIKLVKFKRVFVPHVNFRFETDPLLKMAENIVYICKGPIFDDMIDIEHSDRFEKNIVKAFADFNPDEDVIADYGDALIFAMSVFYLGLYWDEINIARYSSKKSEYLVRPLIVSEYYKYEETP
jgi:hypothetical protein